MMEHAPYADKHAREGLNFEAQRAVGRALLYASRADVLTLATPCALRRTGRQQYAAGTGGAVAGRLHDDASVGLQVQVRMPDEMASPRPDPRWDGQGTMARWSEG